MALTQVQGGMLAGSTNTTTTIQSNGTTAITINSSQNVGVGTSSPANKLDVNSSDNYVARFQNSTNQSLYVYSSSTLSGLVAESTGQNGILFNSNSDFGYIFTDGAERMRVTSDGYVGIGTSTPASYGALAVRKGVNGTWLGVSGNCSFQTSDNNLSSLYVVHSSANSNTTFIGADSGGRLQMFCSATAAGGVYLANGGTSWTSASDERVKENLEPIQNGLEKVTSLRAVTGNYIADETKKSKAFLIAQDVEAVLPEAVDSSNPDELGLAYTDVIPLLVASIKELKAELDATKAEVAALKATP